VSMQHDQLIAALSEAIGSRYVLHRTEELLLYAYDGSTLDQALPQLVVLPGSTAEVAAVVRLAAAAGYPIVARGAGTGLSGGSVPSAGGMVVALTRLNRIMQIDPVERTAEVQAGVVNLDLSMQAAPYGLHFAPDPSSQRASTIGGNVATNAGGPHCLKYGVTANHVLTATVVLSDGSVVRLGSAAPDAPGYDLLGAFIGSEGTFGIATEFTVRLTPVGEEVRTLLAVYDNLDAAGRSVTAIMAAGMLPATMELMENLGVRMVEEQMHVGYPADARAVLLIEIDGLHEELVQQEEQISTLCRQHGACAVRLARDAAERAQLWAGRKSMLTACARVAPHYHIQDVVVPRSRLPEMIRRSEEIARRYELTILTVAHAGDGNAHPTFLFDLQVPGMLERAIAAGEEIFRVCRDLGGAISGEHGIGLEKRSYLAWMFTPDDLQAFQQLRAVFDPTGRMNPGKIFADNPATARTHRSASLPQNLALGNGRGNTPMGRAKL